MTQRESSVWTRSFQIATFRAETALSFIRMLAGRGCFSLRASGADNKRTDCAYFKRVGKLERECYACEAQAFLDGLPNKEESLEFNADAEAAYLKHLMDDVENARGKVANLTPEELATTAALSITLQRRYGPVLHAVNELHRAVVAEMERRTAPDKRFDGQITPL